MIDKQKNKNQTQPSAVNSKKALVMKAIAGIKEGISVLSTKEEVEEATFKVLDNLPESIGLRKMIEDARSLGNKNLEESLVEKNRELYDEIYAEISLIAGIETDVQRVQRENNEYRDLMISRINNHGDEVNEDNILEVLGMLVQDSEGALKFAFSYDLFPPHIREKWDHYAEIVARHTTAIAGRNNGLSNDVELIAQLDAVRTVAHNNLSYAIKDFLALDTWDLEKCRRLVIKMRDSLYPTIETAEKDVTSQEILRLVEIIKEIRKQ